MSTSSTKQKKWLKRRGESHKDKGDGGGSTILKVVSEEFCVKELYVTKLCVWQSCVWKIVWWHNCVWNIVCVTKLCVKDCVWQSCVWKIVCDKVVCVWQSCIWKNCVWQSCGWQSCVWKIVCDEAVCVWQSCVCVTKSYLREMDSLAAWMSRSATPATENEGRCDQVLACHAKWRWMSPSAVPRLPGKRR